MTTKINIKTDDFGYREAVGNLLASLLSSFPSTKISAEVTELGKITYVVNLNTQLINTSSYHSVHLIEDISNYYILTKLTRPTTIKLKLSSKKSLNQALRIALVDLLSISLRTPTANQLLHHKILSKYLYALTLIGNQEEIGYIHTLLNRDSIEWLNYHFTATKSGEYSLNSSSLAFLKSENLCVLLKTP